MPQRNTAELILGANAQRLRQGLAGARREVQTFTARTRTMMSGLGASLRRNLLSIPGQLGLVGGTAGLFMLGRNIVKLDNELNKLQIRGKKTTREMLELKEGMFQVGMETGRSQTSIIEGIAAIQEKTGKYDYALAAYRDLAIASQATGSSMAELGAMASQLDEKFKIQPEGLMEALDILTGQGEEGAFTLEHLSVQGERMLAAAQRLGMRGVDDLRRFGAYAQIAMSASGDAAVAATITERTISELIEKQSKLKKKYGIEVMDKSGNYRKLDVLLKEIITKTKGSELKLGEIFSERAIKGVSTLAAIFRETGGFGRFDELLQNEYGGTIDRFLEGRTKSMQFQIDRLGVLMTKLGESVLLPSLDKINKYVQDLTKDPEKLKELDARFQSFGKTVAGLVSGIAELLKHWKLLLGGFALFKGFNFARSLGLFGGRAGGAGALAGALPGGAGVPVTVTNWPLGFGGGGPGGLVDQFGRPLASSSPAVAMPVNIMSFLGTAGPVALALIAVASFLKKEHALMKQEREDLEFQEKAGWSRVFTTAGSEEQSAPAASLRNEIRLNIDVHVDKDGNKTYTGASVLDSPAKGVSQQTFLESVFVGGE